MSEFSFDEDEFDDPWYEALQEDGREILFDHYLKDDNCKVCGDPISYQWTFCPGCNTPMDELISS